MKLLFLGIFVFTCAAFSQADTQFENANELFRKNNFNDARQIYENLLDEGFDNYELHYNLANTYFKLDMLPNAILHYEKALRLEPGDEDILFNLNVANSQTVDKIEPLPDLLLQDWINDLTNWAGSGRWSFISLLLFWLSMASLFLFYIARSPVFKKAAFAFIAAFLLFAASSFYLASEAYDNESLENEAIIFSESVYVKSSPDESGKDLFILHEGTKVRIIDELKGWNEIRIADGSVGWIPSFTIEII